MFVDKASITVIAGRGGNGAVSFHREKYVPAGGPDGGDGGRGGNIILVPDTNMSTLMDFRYKKKYTAANGADGSGSQKSGRDGRDLLLNVPLGTLIRDKETNALIHDMSDGERYLIAKGGRGGWGNKRFATATRQAPRFAKSGTNGQKREIILELKLLADVGLAGFPNVGKSTFLSVVSRANPKIADYHFTTLYPNLGVAHVDEEVSFVIADIPGIIEGASEGAGLGLRFLRHIERCRLIIHMVDVSGSEGRDPCADLDAVNEELKKYSTALAGRPQIIAANKCDILHDRGLLDKFKEYAESRGYCVYEISAATRAGVRELIYAAYEQLKQLPPPAPFMPDFVEPTVIPESADNLTITVDEATYQVEGAWMENLLETINMYDSESRQFFDKILRESGLFDRLERMGICEGDTVRIYNWEFEYKK